MKNLINKLIKTNNSIAPLLLRIPVGVILAAHGAQNLFGWFGGYGLSGTAGWMDSIGLSPGIVMATLAGSAEFFGGVLLMLGLLTRPAALVSAFTMLVAIFAVHFENGLFLQNKGYEFGLALFAITTSLVVSGAGRISLDKAIEAFCKGKRG